MTETTLEQKVEKENGILKKISDTTRSAYVLFAGNRPNSLMTGFNAISSYAFYQSLQRFSKPEITLLELSTLFFTIGCGIFAQIKGYKCGLGTLRFYQQTREHIKRTGKLEERYLRRMIQKRTENTKTVGYCQQQGMYLAACHLGKKKEFKEARKKYSRVKIPFF